MASSRKYSAEDIARGFDELDKIDLPDVPSDTPVLSIPFVNLLLIAVTVIFVGLNTVDVGLTNTYQIDRPDNVVLTFDQVV